MDRDDANRETAKALRRNLEKRLRRARRGQRKGRCVLGYLELLANMDIREAAQMREKGLHQIT